MVTTLCETRLWVVLLMVFQADRQFGTMNLNGACANVWLLTTGAVRVRHSMWEFATQASHSVDTAGWQAKMASIELWIQWCNAHRPHSHEIAAQPNHSLDRAGWQWLSLSCGYLDLMRTGRVVCITWWLFRKYDRWCQTINITVFGCACYQHEVLGSFFFFFFFFFFDLSLTTRPGSGHLGAGQKGARHFGVCQKVTRSFRRLGRHFGVCQKVARSFPGVRVWG